MLSPSKYALYKHRRDTLLDTLQEDYAEIDNGLVVLIGNFETDRHLFRQESSFYYLTGITEPGAVLFSYFGGHEILYIPTFSGNRIQWVSKALNIDSASTEEICVNEIKPLGLPNKGYTLSPILDQNVYLNVLNDLSKHLYEQNAKVFTLKDKRNSSYNTQFQILGYLNSQLPNLLNATEDCSYLVHEMRRMKDDYEIDCAYKAAQITILAHNAAASYIAPEKHENEIQAIIESVFTMSGASGPAFPSIVATGKNSTVLHYTDRDKALMSGDLVVVDIGAEFKYYAADVTRTYPVSGKFTDRQREVYNIVLETQKYIESIAAPGMYLNNPQKPNQSLQHLAIGFLKEKGYDQYFVHGIGHYLGLDVHDVGDTALPLEEGNMITIEPGIYITDENIGIRIEDDYVIVEGGCLSLTEGLPKMAEEIEVMMEQNR